MQSSINPIKDRSTKDIKELIITILLGMLIGLFVFALFKTLQWIEIQHLVFNEEQIPYHLIGLPFVLVFITQLKKRTLYFPTKVSEVTNSKLELVKHWSPAMTGFHYIGNCLSHFVGASVGREGTGLLMASGLVRLMNLPWAFWGPIAMTVGFTAVVGQPLVAAAFIYELFSTNWRQKLYAFIASYVAVLLLRTLHVPHFLQMNHVQIESSFFQKLLFVIMLGAVAGYSMRLYKRGFHYLANYFKQSTITVKFIVASLLALFLALPGLRKFQSLGLLQIEDFQNLSAQFSDVFIKLAVTALSVSLGFWGGEFIPLVYASLHMGQVTAQILNFDIVLGTAISAFLFFAGATRLKWTSLILTLSLVGWGWYFWVYVMISCCIHFSGPGSVYKSDELIE